MIVPPIPIILALSFIRSLPFYRMLVALFPVHVPGAIFVIVPLVIILVMFVVVPAIIVMILRYRQPRNQNGSAKCQYR